MKKNLISIVILALLIVNIALTAVMMFSVVSTNKKTAKVVTDISSVLALDLNKENNAEESATAVSIDDTAVYNIADKMTIPLKQGADGQSHFALVQVSLAMNTKDKDYKTYGESIADKESLIKGEIIEAFANYSLEDLQANTDAIREDILNRIQTLFDSKFVYKVTFREITPQ